MWGWEGGQGETVVLPSGDCHLCSDTVPWLRAQNGSGSRFPVWVGGMRSRLPAEGCLAALRAKDEGIQRLLSQIQSIKAPCAPGPAVSKLRIQGSLSAPLPPPHCSGRATTRPVRSAAAGSVSVS